MAIATPDDLVNALRGFARRAGVDEQDARVALSMQEGESANVSQLLDSARGVRGISGESLAAIAALLDPIARDKAACEDQVRAQYRKRLVAEAAVNMAGQHVEFQGQGAAGTFYGNR